jgi:hypothetical protein
VAEVVQPKRGLTDRASCAVPLSLPHAGAEGRSALADEEQRVGARRDPRIEVRLQVRDDLARDRERAPPGIGLRRPDVLGAALELLALRAHLQRSMEQIDVAPAQPERVVIEIVVAAPVEVGILETKISDGLTALGVNRPYVAVQTVTELHRQTSGKLKRFVPLP